MSGRLRIVVLVATLLALPAVAQAAEVPEEVGVSEGSLVVGGVDVDEAAVAVIAATGSKLVAPVLQSDGEGITGVLDSSGKDVQVTNHAVDGSYLVVWPTTGESIFQSRTLRGVVVEVANDGTVIAVHDLGEETPTIMTLGGAAEARSMAAPIPEPQAAFGGIVCYLVAFNPYKSGVTVYGSVTESCTSAVTMDLEGWIDQPVGTSYGYTSKFYTWSSYGAVTPGGYCAPSGGTYSHRTFGTVWISHPTYGSTAAVDTSSWKSFNCKN